MKNASVGLVVLSLILSVFIGFALAGQRTDGGTGQAAGTDSTPVIGLSLDTLAEERWKKDRDTFVAAAEKLGAKVEVLSANSDNTKQTADIRSFITRQVDCLVIVAFDGNSLGPVVDEAAAAGIPVIAYDRLIRDTPNLMCYLSFDNVTVGRRQGEYLVEALQDQMPAKIVRIYGAPTDNNARLFKQGQDEILQPYIEQGQIEVVHEAWATGWRPEEANKIAAAAVQKTSGDFDAILASNDGTAGGAIAAIPESMLGKIVVTGQDAELEALRRIAMGTQSMTIYKPIGKLAVTGAELAVKAARRQVIVANSLLENGAADIPSIFDPVYAVTAANMVDTVVADNFVTYDDIYRDVPEDRRPAQPGD